jgi:hypothetical protein
MSEIYIFKKTTFWPQKSLSIVEQNLSKIISLHLTQEQQGVVHTVALPFTLKSILRQKKNCGNSNISASYSLQKNPLKKKPKSFKILLL